MADEGESKKPRFEPLKAVGIFLSVFGAVVCFAALKDMDLAEKLINLASGAVIILIGAACFLVGLKQGRAGEDAGEAGGPDGTAP